MSCCSDDIINPREFYLVGDLITTESIDPGTGWDQDTETVFIKGLRAKLLNPLKTDGIEVFEFDQQVAKQKQSYLVRNTAYTRQIKPRKSIYEVDGGRYHVIQVRRYKGGRRYFVLDTVARDNDSGV